MCFLMLICYSKIHFHQLGSFKLMKTMLKSLKVCKVYFMSGIFIQRVVTKHMLPSVQLSRMLNSNIEFAKNKCLGTIWSTEMNPFLLEPIQLESIIKRLFPVTLQFDPLLVHDQFSFIQYDAWLQKTCDAAVRDIHFHWYHLNRPISLVIFLRVQLF